MLYTDKFIQDRKYLIKNNPDTWGKIRASKTPNGLPIIELPLPQILAGFAGYLKYQCSTNVFFRGEKNYHKTTIPSLFRVKDGDLSCEIPKRKKAYDTLVETISDIYKPKRFQRKDIRPLLQHYGVKTDWLDLVDNIFVALWFSNNDSDEKFSYIKFFVESTNTCTLIVKNLRQEIASLSLRAHCQHGISSTKDVEWSIENINFNSNLIAIAKLPNNHANRLKGYIFSESFMFPNEELDNTYNFLKINDLQELLHEIAEESDLEKEALGKFS